MDVVEQIEAVLNRATQDFDGRDDIMQRAADEIKRLRALAERAGGVKVLRNVEFTLVLRDDAVSLWCGSDEDAQRIYSAIEALTTEPAAPEGQQTVAVEDAAKLIYAEMDYAAALPGEQGEGLLPWGQDQHLMGRALKVATALTRHAEQAVTEAMVEAAVQAVRQYTRETLLIDEHRELVRAALKAAMEAGR